MTIIGDINEENLTLTSARQSSYLILPFQTKTPWVTAAEVDDRIENFHAKKSSWNPWCCGGSNEVVQISNSDNLRYLSVIQSVFQKLPSSSETSVVWGAAVKSGERNVDIFSGRPVDSICSPAPNINVMNVSFIPWDGKVSEAMEILRCNLVTSSTFCSSRRNSASISMLGNLLRTFDGLILQFHLLDKMSSMYLSSLTVMLLDTSSCYLLDSMISSTASSTTTVLSYNHSHNNPQRNIHTPHMDTPPHLNSHPKPLPTTTISIAPGLKLYYYLFGSMLNCESKISVYPPHPSLTKRPQPMALPKPIKTLRLLDAKDSLPTSFVAFLKKNPTVASPLCPPGWTLTSNKNPSKSNMDLMEPLQGLPEWSIQNSLANMHHGSPLVLHVLAPALISDGNLGGMYFRAKLGDNIVVNQGWDRGPTTPLPAMILLLPGKQ